MESSKTRIVEIEGVRIPIFFSEKCFRSATRYQPKSDDIFVVTYPKCGTTWMQYLVLNILRKGKPLEKPRDFFLASPFLDQLGAEDSENMMIRPGVYKTHLPFHKVPWSDEAKYIYVARNPKDCCVSFYHHMHQIPGYQFQNHTFDDFFNLFIKGEVDFNNYFDHLLPWYNARHKSNVFFTSYEAMKEDLGKIAIKVAEFLGKDYANYFYDSPEILQNILQKCSFKEMKFIDEALSHFYNNPEKLLADPNIPEGRKHIIRYNASLPKEDVIELNFVRRGQIGNWKMLFTFAQNEILNDLISEKTKNSDVMAMWEGII